MRLFTPIFFLSVLLSSGCPIFIDIEEEDLVNNNQEADAGSSDGTTDGTQVVDSGSGDGTTDGTQVVDSGSGDGTTDGTQVVDSGSGDGTTDGTQVVDSGSGDGTTDGTQVVDSGSGDGSDGTIFIDAGPGEEADAGDGESLDSGISLSPCDVVDCMDNSHCVDTGGTAECVCDDDYEKNNTTGLCEQSACEPNPCSDDSGCTVNENNVPICGAYYATCHEIKMAGAGSEDGTYWIEPLGDGSTPFKAWCDMTSDENGWTLVGMVHNASQNDVDEDPMWFINGQHTDPLHTNTLIENAIPSSFGVAAFMNYITAAPRLTRFDIHAADNLSMGESWYKHAAPEAIGEWFSLNTVASMVCSDFEMSVDCSEGTISTGNELYSGTSTVLEGMVLSDYGGLGPLGMRQNGDSYDFNSGVCSITQSSNTWPDTYETHWGNALRIWLTDAPADFNPPTDAGPMDETIDAGGACEDWDPTPQDCGGPNEVGCPEGQKCDITGCHSSAWGQCRDTPAPDDPCSFGCLGGSLGGGQECGCDGITYTSACHRRQADVAQDPGGSCTDVNIPFEGNSCDPTDSASCNNGSDPVCMGTLPDAGFVSISMGCTPNFIASLTGCPDGLSCFQYQKRTLFCEKPYYDCGGTTGTCKHWPQSDILFCPDPPFGEILVCGCDGSTYRNTCELNAAEVGLAEWGECPDSGVPDAPPLDAGSNNSGNGNSVTDAGNSNNSGNGDSVTDAGSNNNGNGNSTTDAGNNNSGNGNSTAE